jgi:hypothetical protein
MQNLRAASLLAEGVGSSADFLRFELGNEPAFLRLTALWEGDCSRLRREEVFSLELGELSDSDDEMESCRIRFYAMLATSMMRYETHIQLFLISFLLQHIRQRFRLTRTPL